MNNCVAEGVLRALEVRNNRALGKEEFLCEEHAHSLWQAHLAEDRAITGLQSEIVGACSFELELVMAYEKKQAYTVLLREVGGKRIVFLPIGYLELCILYNAVLESPYSHLVLHAIMLGVIQNLGARLTYVIVNDVDSQWHFKAKLVFLTNQDAIEFQSRPSDGLILANLANVPFVIKESVIAKLKESGRFINPAW